MIKSQQSIETVLLLDGQTIQALPVMKSLKSKGFRIIIFCNSKNSYGYYSRYSDEKLLCPNWYRDPDEFYDFFFQFLSSNTIDAVIPMNDDSATFLSQHLNEVNNYSKCLIPDIETFMNGFNKNSLMKLCKDQKLPHPFTADLERLDLEEASVSVGFPAIIKPNITTGGRGMKSVNSLTELQETYPSLREQYGPCHLQQFILPGGEQYKVQIFTDQNGIQFDTVIKKIRYYPVKGGSSCCNVTVEKRELVNLCAGILKRLNWIGFADFDLIEDPSDGIIKVMEINPRMPACIRSSIESGVDFAEAIVNKTLNKPIPTYHYLPGKYLRYFGMDLLWFIKSKHRFHTHPAWFNFFGKNIYYQDGNYQDPLPIVMGTLSGILKQLNPEFRKTKSGI